MRVCLHHKLVLAHSLTSDQAHNLVNQIRSRKSLDKIYSDALWIAKNDTGYYVYILDERAKAFIKDPESFIFEV